MGSCCCRGGLGTDRNGVARTLFEAGRTTGAFVEVDAVPIACSQLDNRVFGTGAVAAVTLEAVATREATLCFELNFCVA